MDTLGAVVGPLIGLAGYELLDHKISSLLYIAIVPAVASVALVALVRERPDRLSVRTDHRWGRPCMSCQAGIGG